MILISNQSFACLWDRDTLAEEAKGRPDLVRIVTGWFDRYPPRYYQMRLDRVAVDLKSAPADLALHDDAAVACDRLGRPDEAIGWMARKKVVLDSLPVQGRFVRFVAAHFDGGGSAGAGVPGVAGAVMAAGLWSMASISEPPVSF